jgi:hypothetical protein
MSWRVKNVSIRYSKYSARSGIQSRHGNLAHLFDPRVQVLFLSSAGPYRPLHTFIFPRLAPIADRWNESMRVDGALSKRLRDPKSAWWPLRAQSNPSVRPILPVPITPIFMFALQYGSSAPRAFLTSAAKGVRPSTSTRSSGRSSRVFFATGQQIPQTVGLPITLFLHSIARADSVQFIQMLFTPIAEQNCSKLRENIVRLLRSSSACSSLNKSISLQTSRVLRKHLL